jgi:hypothetical protein
MPDPNHPIDSEHSRYHVAKHHKLIAEAFERVLAGQMPAADPVGAAAARQVAAREDVPRRAPRPLPVEAPDDGHVQPGLRQRVRRRRAQHHRSEEYQRVYPDTQLRTGSKAKDHMVTTRGGKLSFLGRGGSGTGRPADGFLVDDPLKDAKEAESKAVRDDVWVVQPRRQQPLPQR